MDPCCTDGLPSSVVVQKMQKMREATAVTSGTRHASMLEDVSGGAPCPFLVDPLCRGLHGHDG